MGMGMGKGIGKNMGIGISKKTVRLDIRLQVFQVFGLFLQISKALKGIRLAHHGSAGPHEKDYTTWL